MSERPSYPPSPVPATLPGGDHQKVIRGSPKQAGKPPSALSPTRFFTRNRGALWKRGGPVQKLGNHWARSIVVGGEAGEEVTRRGRKRLELCRKQEHPTMLRYAVIFAIIALVAAVFGFGIIESTAAGIAKILFFVFLVLFVISLFTGRRTAA